MVRPPLRIPMRHVYTAFIVILLAIVGTFALQNLGSVRVAFLTASLRLPLAVLVVLVYGLGMVTGGFMLSVLRRSIRGARQQP